MEEDHNRTRKGSFFIKARLFGMALFAMLFMLNGPYVNMQPAMAMGDFWKASDLAEKTKEKAADLADKAKDTASDLATKTKEKASELATKAKEVTAKATEKAGDLADKTKEKASELATKTKEKAAELAVQTKEKASELATKTKEAAGKATEQAKAGLEKAKSKVAVGVAKTKEMVGQKVASLKGTIKPTGNYDKDRWHPIHFKPMIDTATNEQCLSCHKEVLEQKPRTASPAGVKAATSIAWYQTLDTYKGEQMTFHQRHLTSAFAKEVMDLKCVFCHKGNDLREEVPGSHKGNVMDTSHAMRKTVDPAKTCLRCHGKFPFEVMEGLEGPWHEARKDLEDPEDPDLQNGCMSCHGESYRTVRHQVNYLKAENIEKMAKEGSSDSCYGCHGGRQWYRTNYPYPRHKWPGMEDVVDGTPDWAKNRPTESAPEDRKAAK